MGVTDNQARLQKIGAASESIARSFRLLADAGIPLEPSDLYELAQVFDQMAEVADGLRSITSSQVTVQPRLRVVT